jgi:hypothetical protein
MKAVVVRAGAASARAVELARQLDKAALVEVILNSRGIIRNGGRALVVETHHGLSAPAPASTSQMSASRGAHPKTRRFGAAHSRRDSSADRQATRRHYQRQFRPPGVGTVDIAVGIAA